MKLAVVGKKHGELGGERQPCLKKPPPFEAGRIEMLEGGRIIADGADVIGAKTGGREFDGIARHFAIVEFAESSDVDKCKMAHVEKSFDLSSGGSVQLNAVWQHL